jgi:spermidine synthase
MKKFERLGEAIAPDGTVLTLYRHDGAYSLRVQGVELMSTRRHESEDSLAERVCRPLEHTPGARVLIGGLGFGFTLAAALRSLAADARVVVAELVSEVIEWNRNPEYPLAGEALRDERVELRHADVASVLSDNPGAFDAIMLDVDNGADSLTTSGNAPLYRTAGIEQAAAALRPGPQSRLAYWSANDDPVFLKSLRRAGLTVETTRVRSHAKSGTWHTLFVARLSVSSRA